MPARSTRPAIRAASIRARGAGSRAARSAAAHHPSAEYRLGGVDEEGTRVEKKRGFARTHEIDAAARGVPEAKERLAELSGPAPATTPAGNP